MISSDLVNLLNKPVSILALSLTLGLTSCGGGGDSAPATTSTVTPPLPDEVVETQSITGGGVKGPLANAVVTVYAFDASKAGFKGAAVGTGNTDASAAITGLALPFPLNPPYIMEFTSAAGTTTDITTGLFPVITTMRTVITQASIDAGEQIYATPLTTMAVDIAVANANAGSGSGTSSAQFETALTAAAAQVVSTLGFGMDSSVNIFDTPPLINSTTAGAAEQAAVAAYRTAVEAVTAIAYQISEQSAGATTDTVLEDLAATLADNGIIDESAGATLDSNTLQILEQDPASLPIPNSTQTVADVQTILAAETATTGSTTTTTELTDGTITTDPTPAETDPDIDNDGVLNADDAFPENGAESVDTDGDGIGDVADPDDNNNGILDVDEGSTPVVTGTDTDGDGFDDGVDNCPTNYNPAQTNTDTIADGGDACDSDDDEDGVLDTADAFPLDSTESVDTDGDGLGNDIADSDDDNDGVADASDTGVSPLDGSTPCAVLIDCDGDGVLDGADFNPVDAAVTINFAPITADSDVTTDEDVAVAFTLSVTDDGVAPGPLIYNISPVGHGILSGTAPDLTYTPDADFSGSDSFIFTVVDSAGKMSNISGGSLTVVAVNDAPIIAQPGPLAVVMDEDASPATFVAPVITASDEEGDALTWSLSSAATDGSASVSGTGAEPTVAYVPNADFNGADSFEVSVSDGNGGVDAITVEVTVNEQNDAPVIAVAGPFSIAEDAADMTVVGSVLAVDVDSPVTGYNITAGDAGGAFDISTAGQITVADTAAIDYETATVFSLTITATDGVTPSAGVAVTVNINDVNDTAPVVGAAGPFDIAEDAVDTTVVGSVSATDADMTGSVTAYNITVGDAAGAFAISSAGQISVADTTAIDYEVATSFNLTITATDGTNVSAGEIVTVNINDVNDTAPVVVAAGPFSIAEDAVDTTVVGSVSATDADTVGSVTAYNITSGDAAGAFTISSVGQITVADTTAIDHEVATSFDLTITATDGINVSAGEVVTVNISDVNDTAPVVGAAGPFNIAEDAIDASVVGSVIATDADSVVTDYSISSGDAGGAFTISPAGQITVADTTAIDYEVATSFNLTITATDGTNVSAGEVVTVNITDANDTAPVVAAGQSFNVIATAGNGTPVGTVSASDADGVGSITGFTVTPSTVFAIDNSGQITVAAALVAGTTYTLSVEATDSLNISAAVNVDVTAVNNAPPVIAQTGPLLVTMDEDETPQAFVAPAVSATDAEGDSLSWSTPGAANGLAEVFGAGVNAPTLISYTPNPDFSGEDNFIVNVSDGTSIVGITITVTVDPVNDVPVANQDDETTAEDTAFTTGNVLTNDNDGGDGPSALSITFYDPVSVEGGVVGYNDNGTFDYSPPGNFNGLDSFSYTVSDGDDAVVGQVSIDVTPENDPPEAVNDNEITTVDTGFTTGNVLSNDTDVEGDELSVVAGNPTAAHGTVVNNNNGTFTYTPDAAYVGADLFTYTVSDSVDTAEGTVNITITPAGDPIAMTDLLGTTEGGVGALDSYTNNVGVNEYDYWIDVYDSGAQTFAWEDYSFNHLTAAFEFAGSDTTDPDVALNGGTWVNEGIIRVVEVDDGSGNMTIGVRDEADTVDVEQIKLSARYADLSGELISDYLDTQWQSAMFDSSAEFGASAKLITSYSFEMVTDGYLMRSGNDCLDWDPARYATLNTTATNNNCNGIDVPASVDVSGFATSLDQLEVSTPFVDNNDGAIPEVAVAFGWEGSTLQLRVEFAPGNVANYYVIDWPADAAGTTTLVATGTYTRDDTVQGVDMIRFIPPAAAYVQFPEVMAESTGYLVAMEGGFVRLGDYILAGSVNSEIDTLFNGHALTEILANFSGDNYTTTGLADTTLYDIYFDKGIEEFLIDVFNFNADGTLTTCDYQDCAGSTEAGTWAVSATGNLHITVGVDDWWYKVKELDPDTGVKGVCASATAAGTANCTVLDMDFDLDPLYGFQHADEATAVGVMDMLNGAGPQIPVTLKNLDGNSSVITGIWGDAFVAADLVTGTHTLDFGEGPAILTLDAGGTSGSIEFSPSEINTITSWSVDDVGVLRFTEVASDSSVADWTVGYFDTVAPGNVLVAQSDGFFVMAGFDETLAAFDAAALAGTTQYNVFYCDDGDAGCTIGDWDLVALAFDANASDLVVTYDGSDYPGTYSVTDGVLVATFDGGTDYIRILSVDQDTGALRTCWEGSLEQTSYCTGNGNEFLFDNLTDAQDFQTAMSFTAGATVDATALLAGGIFEFWDDEWDGSQQVPAYWTMSVNGATIVDSDFVWSRALHKFLPQTWSSTGIMLTASGWQVGSDDIADAVISGNQATLNIRAPDDEIVQSIVVTYEAMDIAGREIGLYAPATMLDDASATFSSGAQWVQETVSNTYDTYQLDHWDDGCSEYATWGDNCNVVWQRTMTGTDVETNLPTATDFNFIDDATQTIELGHHKYSGFNGTSLLGIFNSSGNTISYWIVNWDAGTTAVDTGVVGTYTQSTVDGEVIIEYTVPTNIPDYNQFNLYYDLEDNETGILAVHLGYLRYGDKELSTASSTWLDLNAVAANDVFSNIPAVPEIIGSWLIEADWDNATYPAASYAPNTVTFFGDGNYFHSGPCEDPSLSMSTDAVFDIIGHESGAATDASLEYGPYTWNSTTGDYTVNPIVDANNWCGLNDTSNGDNSGNLVINGDVLTLGGSVVANRVTTGTQAIVGTWVLDPTDPVIFVFYENGYFTQSQSCYDHESFDGMSTYTPEPIDGGMEYGTYSWNSGTGALTGNVLIDTNGWCGTHSTNEASTAIGAGSTGVTVTVGGDVMTFQVGSEEPATLYRVQ